MSEPRPWRRALVWLAFLGPFFFASYGFANWLASRRVNVGDVAWPWEHAIPFLPWTIVPYWSIDLLYALSFFVVTTRSELDRHAQRLLTVQIISVTFFIFFPLRFSFDRPVATGLFGTLFTALGSFDKPFNQAPSLHISILVVVWVCLARHMAVRWRWALHAWMTLIGLSILSTYQHHFVDLPTGLLVGFVALWALPEGQPSPLSQLTFTTDRTRRRLALRYAVAALLVGTLACRGGAWLWLFWPAIALALVAFNYVLAGARGFQKQTNGRMSHGSAALLAPYTTAAWINSRIWTRRHPKPSLIVDDVWIGRIPSSMDLEGWPFAAVVDLSAELACGSRKGIIYHSIPMLDLTVPPPENLRAAAEVIQSARSAGPVLVCCALGYSRSAAAVVAWLVMTKRAASVQEATQLVQRARPAVVLHDEHHAALEALA
ncbi:MAG: phosphatase PAP2/dual specificity phosphatase family protein [Acidobacteriota bacterium]